MSLINIIEPHNDEAFIGWLLNLAEMNGCDSIEELLCLTPELSIKVNSTFIRGAESMLALLMASFTDNADLMKLATSSTSYGFYRHFADAGTLHIFLDAMGDSKPHPPCRIGSYRTARLQFCPDCDAYYKTYNQLPGVTVCRECGHKLSIISINTRFGRKGIRVDQDDCVSKDSMAFRMSQLVYEIWKSKLMFSHMDIKHALAEKYLKDTVRKRGHWLDGEVEMMYMMSRWGMSINDTALYERRYFFDYSDEGYWNDQMIIDALKAILALFGDYEHFISFMIKHKKCSRYPVIENHSNLGIYGKTLKHNSRGIYEVAYPCGRTSLKSIETLTYGKCTCSKCIGPYRHNDIFERRIIK